MIHCKVTRSKRRIRRSCDGKPQRLRLNHHDFDGAADSFRPGQAVETAPKPHAFSA